MKIEIDSSKGKARLPELLRMVKRGKCIAITSGGVVIAHLVPSTPAKTRNKASAVEKLETFMRQNPLRGANVRSLIDAGRS